MKRLNKTKKHLKYVFMLLTAAVLLVSSLITSGIELTLRYFGIINQSIDESSWVIIGIVMGVVCAIIGAALSLITNKFIMRYVNEMFDGMEKLAEGKYDTRLDFGKSESLSVASESFNKLAEELADVIITTMVIAARYGIDLEEAVTDKLAYNIERDNCKEPY